MCFPSQVAVCFPSQVAVCFPSQVFYVFSFTLGVLSGVQMHAHTLHHGLPGCALRAACTYRTPWESRRGERECAWALRFRNPTRCGTHDRTGTSCAGGKTNTQNGCSFGRSGMVLGACVQRNQHQQPQQPWEARPWT